MFLRREGIHDTAILAAMERVPREQFVSTSFQKLAYENQSLPLIAGQTLSQPLVVAKMTQALELTPESRVLEIGTGSGYQAAVLSHLCRRVASIERVTALHQSAKNRLQALEIYNVDLRLADGFRGWPEAAPFDAMILTCAPLQIAEVLLTQLQVGGRLVAPVGNQEGAQKLRIFKRETETKVRSTTLGLAQFVPMLEGLA